MKQIRPVELRILSLSAIVLLATGAAAQDRAGTLETAAERSSFQETTGYDEVMQFCRELDRRSAFVRLGQLGKSAQGRDLPLLILADPPVETAEQARRQVEQNGKLVVLALGNMHAGEVCGKEALLMLAREIAASPQPKLLKDLILLVAPIYNADGNERTSAEHRPQQRGPERVGQRENAQGLDLNRDFVKLQAPETQALVKLLKDWDPYVFIDTHTTNGSYHRYTITYDGPRHPAVSPALVRYAREEFLPEAGRRLQQQEGYRSFFYGNFDPPHEHWETYPALPRYGVQYVGLRGGLAILCEAYAYAPFRDRVLATRSFVGGSLQLAAEQKEPIRKLVREARSGIRQNSARSLSDSAAVPIRGEPVPLEGKVAIAGFVEEDRGGKRVATEVERDYDVRFLGETRPTRSVARPHAYLLPAEQIRAIENLRKHGIELHVLREDIELDVEVYRIEEVSRAERPYQNHRLATVEATPRTEARRFPAGTVLVRANQPLGNLLVNLLEPEAEDGLGTWGLFDDALSNGKDYPVARLMAEEPVLVAPLPPKDRQEPTPRKRITFDVLNGRNRPNFSGSPATGFEWLDDGEHYLQVKQGRLCKVQATTGRSRPFFDVKKLQAALEELPTIDADSARRLAQDTSPRMNPNRTGALYQHENDLYFAGFDGTQAVRLTSTPGREELATFSPDGQFVAFVRDYNLHVVDLATQTERALTADGHATLRNGKADWVYFEEIFNRSWHAFHWSPDSTRLAFMQFDDSPVDQFTVIDQIPTRQKVEVERYPKAGDPNPRVRLGVVTAAGGPVRWIDLGDYQADWVLITGFGWTPDGSVYCYVQDRAQRWLDFLVAQVGGEGRAGPHGEPAGSLRGSRTGNSVKRLFRDETKAWVDVPGEPQFLKDGSFLLPSERSGWRHLYHFAADGKLRRQVTDGNWEVRQVHAVDEEQGWIYVSGTRDSHIASQLYRVPLAEGEPQRLTGRVAVSSGTGVSTVEHRRDAGAASDRASKEHGADGTRSVPAALGHHQVTVGPQGKLYVSTVSDHHTPAQVFLHHADGRLARTLDTNPVPAIEEYEFGKLELLQVPTRDGFLMEASLVLPPDFDPEKKYPVWFMTYGGPHAPSIVDAWQGGRTFDQMLANLGIIAFRCDPRSASGKGATSTWTAYRQLGVQELADVEDAIRWLSQRGYVDGSRIGMSGHSYGGFLTAYALTHSKLFVAGIAGAPVTDWRNYDTIYTERYMNTPQENPSGYEKTSVVAAAGNLHGKLLLLHGVMDDNVHWQNTLQLAHALQAANKDFELMVYPQSRHGLSGEHYQRLILDFIRRNLQVDHLPQ
jgi:dipeptidyl aminopeptidase/acylaminoacyl peptidase